ARRELRQLLPGGVAEFEQVDAIGNFVIARDAQRHPRWRGANGHCISDASGVRHNKWRLWTPEARDTLRMPPSRAGNILLVSWISAQRTPVLTRSTGRGPAAAMGATSAVIAP